MKLVFLFLSLGTAAFAGASATNAPVGEPFKVHGRLSGYCGTPACRIWLVGTPRMLGVAEADPSGTALMPAGLHALLQPDALVFGDFTLVPLTREKTGVMQIVKVIAAENLVVTDHVLRPIARVPKISSTLKDSAAERDAVSRSLRSPIDGFGSSQNTSCRASTMKLTYTAADLIPERTYRVCSAFKDYDGQLHEVGETWRFLRKNFVPYDDGLSLFVEQGGRQIQIRLQWRQDAQADVIDRFSDHVDIV